MILARHLQLSRTSVARGSLSRPSFALATLLPSRKSYIVNRISGAFTLVEMLTVIAIIGIIAALAVPVLKNFGKGDVAVSASRQLLDDVGHARQLAMSQRTTVYMVFLPTNYWVYTVSKPTHQLFDVPNYPSMTVTQQLVATNLLEKQLTGYIVMALGAVGDQPGNHQWHYLTSWQSLPNGAYIPMWKFYNAKPPFTFSDPINSGAYFSIYPFAYTNTFPFPTESSPAASQFGMSLPFIAFNYLGQLAGYSGQMLTTAGYTNIDQDYTGGGIDIPLAQGSVLPYISPSNKVLQVGPPQVTEMPPGNSTNIAYTVIHIDPLTGRATLEFHKMQQ
jgi:prepilin-type N-terminal cleavage/methylation domain-containing protein